MGTKFNMTKTFCLLNHYLTQKQIDEIKGIYHSEEIIYPPSELSSMWSQINPENDNCEIVQSVISWIKTAQKGDFFIIQGEFGTTFKLVDYALKNELIPIYATTKRITKESIEGEIIHRENIFEHVCFKKYEYYR